MGHDTPDPKDHLTPLSSLWFFGNEIVLLAHNLGHSARWGLLYNFKTVLDQLTPADRQDALSCQVEIMGPDGSIRKGTPYQLLLHADEAYPEIMGWVRQKYKEIQPAKHTANMFRPRHADASHARDMPQQFRTFTS